MPVIIIGAIDKDRGIGLNNELPWHITEDLKFFKEKTINNVVVMGNNTFKSLGNKELKDRKNIVLTKNNDLIENNPDLYMNMEKLNVYINKNRKKVNIYIIGGEMLYNYFIRKADIIYLTVIDKNFGCDCKFPFIPNNYEITNYSQSKFDDTQNVNYRFIEYRYTKEPCLNEFQYLHLAQDILKYGNERTDRTGVGTKSLFGRQMRFDISKSVPILTTKKVPFKLTIEELLWFLRGETDSKILEEKGIKIWSGNTSREFLDNRGLNHYEIGDIGPMYGWVWRHFGANYVDCKTDYSGKGIDQLEQVIHMLKTDPFSRRILMTDYDPSIADKGVLICCHGIVVQFYVEVIDGIKHLSCHVYIRSNDQFLGQPINILSYSILTYIIALKTELKPKELVISLGDCHIYKSHLTQIKQQLMREPLTPPKLVLNPEIKNKDWKDITVDDFELIGYNYNVRPTIKAPMAV